MDEPVPKWCHNDVDEAVTFINEGNRGGINKGKALPERYDNLYFFQVIRWNNVYFKR